MKNNSTKRVHKNTPVKRLVSITVDRFRKASAAERQSILSFFDWLIASTSNPELRAFHASVKSKFAEVK